MINIYIFFKNILHLTNVTTININININIIKVRDFLQW